MNLGKKGVQKRLHDLDSHSVMLGNKAGVSALRIALLVITTVIVVGFSAGIGLYRGIIDSSPEIAEVNIMPLGQATMIYDMDGNLIQQLNSSSGNRISVSIEDIPEDMQHAIVAIEDSRFYTHNGVDPQGMLRAVAVAISTGLRRTEGASTITQQLLKNNVFTNWTNEGKLQGIKRKLQEQHLAVELEAALEKAAREKKGNDPKSVILENYLNTVNFGSGCYGVQTAALHYFGKEAPDLTLSECAVLAAIPQNPTKWNPLNHPENNVERRDKVLRDMRTQEYITEEQYQEALADTEDVYKRIQNHSDATPEEKPYSYFIDELIVQLKHDLMEQRNYTAVQANNAIYSGGLQIYTTQDSQIQSILEEEFSNEENYPGHIGFALDWAMTVKNPDDTLQNYSREMLQLYFRNSDPDFDLLFDTEEEALGKIQEYKDTMGISDSSIVAEWHTCTPQPQAAMTVLDQTNSYVKGIVGGRGEKTASLTLNRATDSYRQPGSTFKILSTYGPALDNNAITLSSPLDDEPYNYTDGSPIHNADNSYHGTVSVRTAIQNSYNIPAIKVLNLITPQTGMNYLQRMGFKKLIDDPQWDVIEPLALGGITNGVSNLELTAAYAAIANKGLYTSPTFYTKVIDPSGNLLLGESDDKKDDPSGNLLLDATAHQEHVQVFKESTAYLLTSAMEDVVKQGTGVEYQLNNMTVAGKTGTTTSYRDLVFAGFTPYYTSAIWAGCDVSLELPPEYQSYHKGLWTKVMNRIDEAKGLQNRPLLMPSSVEQKSICTRTGLLAGIGCNTTTEYYASDNAPVGTCYDCKPPEPTPTPTPSATPTPTPTPTPSPTPEEEQEPQEEETPPENPDQPPAETLPDATQP